MLKRLLLSMLPVLLLLSGCAGSPSAQEEYTLRLSLPRAPSCWNPHTRTAEEDLFLSAFCEMGFVRPGCPAESSSSGWIYEMALSIEDITQSYAECSAWGIEDTGGRVFQITLNPDAVWEDGTPISADSYIQSMHFLLDPQQQNSGASPFLEGPAALCNARSYAQSGTPQYVPVVPYHEAGVPAQYPPELDGLQTYLHLRSHSMTLSREYSVEDLMHLGYVDEQIYHVLAEQADPYGYIPVTEENAETVRALASDVLAYFGLLYNEDSFMEMLFRRTGENWPEVSFSQVGLQKTGSYELLYITESVLSPDDFLRAMTENWLVYPALYEKDPQLYGTSAQTYLSYGPYRLDSMEEDGTITLSRNTLWYGFRDEPSTPALSPTRIQCIITDEANALSLWERGLLDLCSVGYSENTAQLYSPFVQNCDACGSFRLVSPRLDPTHHHCSAKKLFLCCYSFNCSDTDWEIYRNARGGYAVLPIT